MHLYLYVFRISQMDTLWPLDLSKAEKCGLPEQQILQEISSVLLW